MSDKVFEGFLTRQHEAGCALAASSDILKLQPLGGPASQHYLAEFHCRGLVQNCDGQIAEWNRFAVGIFFPPDYLRRAVIPEVLTWLEPRHVHHPNILPPVICVGRLEPGTELVDLLYQIFEVIAYRKFNCRENDALNKRACPWVRNNLSRFPVDSRPLKRSSRPPPEQLHRQEATL
jgi:hypothetical protein